MKRVLTAVLLCLLVLLCGCTRQPEAEPPAQEAVSVSPVPVQENDPASVEQKTEAQDPVPIPDGIVKINGLAIYYQNGQPLAGTGLTELDGQLLYVQPDGSLFFFSRGVNRCGDTLYYQTGEDGYALLPPPAGLYDDGQALYDVQPDGSLLTGSADGHLTFGADGRYTSGSEELDTGIAQLLSDSNPDALDARETRLSTISAIISNTCPCRTMRPERTTGHRKLQRSFCSRARETATASPLRSCTVPAGSAIRPMSWPDMRANPTTTTRGR